MAAEKEPFLVPAPPPPLKDESGGGGGPEVQSHQEAASGELRDGTEHGPGPRAHSAGAAASGGGGPQAQAHGERWKLQTSGLQEAPASEFRLRLCVTIQFPSGG